MTFRTFLPVFFSAMLVMACSPTGPVRFYSGPPQPKDKLAIIVVPAPITVRSIDGQEVDSPSKESGSYEVQLTPGHHLIAFRYELFWGTNDSGTLIKSHEVGVDAEFEAGKTYAIRYKVPSSTSEAADFRTDFTATLVDQSGGQQYRSYVIRNMDNVLAAKRIGTAAATTNPATAAATIRPSAASPGLSADAAEKANPVKRLKFWWLMANEQERKQFTQWMKTATENFAPAPKQAPDDAPPGTINGVKIKP
jgi:uncharacterized protein YccT (UPF0319 family)